MGGSAVNLLLIGCVMVLVLATEEFDQQRMKRSGVFPTQQT